MRVSHVRVPIAGGAGEIGVTVYTRGADEWRALRSSRGKLVRFVVRVAIAPEDDVKAGRGFAWFTRERPSPWGLVVEGVL